jgi:hypothetical protein
MVSPDFSIPSRMKFLMPVNQTQKPVELEGYMANKFDFGSLDLSMYFRVV